MLTLEHHEAVTGFDSARIPPRAARYGSRPAVGRDVIAAA